MFSTPSALFHFPQIAILIKLHQEIWGEEVIYCIILQNLQLSTLVSYHLPSRFSWKYLVSYGKRTYMKCIQYFLSSTFRVCSQQESRNLFFQFVIVRFHRRMHRFRLGTPLVKIAVSGIPPHPLQNKLMQAYPLKSSRIHGLLDANKSEIMEPNVCAISILQMCITIGISFYNNEQGPIWYTIIQIRKYAYLSSVLCIINSALWFPRSVEIKNNCSQVGARFLNLRWILEFPRNLH